MNGGQHTHVASQLGLGYAGLDDGERAHHVFDLINPIHHASTRADAERYRVEPCVIAADVVGVAPHTGQGGWTWYTGSAVWTWRLGVEGILGPRLQNGCVLVDPCLPKNWGYFDTEVTGPAGALSIRVADPEHLGCGVVEINDQRFAGSAWPRDWLGD